MSKVDHPVHYNSHASGIEAIDLCEQLSFNIGNAVKYLFRLGLKGDALEDMEKSQFYLRREMARLHTLQERIDRHTWGGAKENYRTPTFSFMARLEAQREMAEIVTSYVRSMELAEKVCAPYHAKTDPVEKDPLLVVLSNLFDLGVCPRLLSSSVQDRIACAERQLLHFIVTEKNRRKKEMDDAHGR